MTRSQNEIIPTSEASSLTASEDLATSIGFVIDKATIAAGWRALDTKSHKMAVATWLEIFQDAGIPPDAVNDCYLAAIRRRRKMRNDGAEYVPGEMSAEFIADQWESTVREIYYGNRLALKKTVPRNCPKCRGTGQEHVFDETGELLGVRPGYGCDHIFPGYDPNADPED